MIIYLARHGQTTGDVENRYGGDYEDHMTDLGRQQAAKLAEQLSDKHVKRLFASPKIRAQEAAAIVADRLGLRVEIIEEFRERNGYGLVTGMIKEQAAKKYPEFVKGLKEDVHFTVEGGENYSHFKHRITNALELLHSTSDSAVVVTHGGPIRLIFRDILKLGEID